MSNNNIPTDFDLPEKNLGEQQHYIPRKARREPEISRRRGLPTGTLLAWDQYKGLEQAAAILRAQNPSDRDFGFSATILGASALNSAWYSFAKEAPVMRRRLKLPMLATDDPEHRLTSADLHQKALEDLELAAGFAERLHGATERQAPKLEKYRIWFGRHIGNTALTLGCVELADQLAAQPELSNIEVQLAVRDQSLGLLASARNLAEPIGSYPSLAQLADHDSDLSVFWRRQAPNEAFDAYERAVESVFST